MLLRFLPLLLVSLTLACISGVTGQGGDSNNEADTRRSRDAAVIVVTVTPFPSDNLSAPPTVTLPENATPTAMPEPDETVEPTETPEPVGSLSQVEPTETPEPEPTETPEPDATETPTPTVTASPSPTPSPTATPTPEPTSTASAGGLGGIPGDMLKAHNDARTAQGLSPLVPNTTLAVIARERAETMAAGTFSHHNPDGGTVFTMMNARGYSYTDGAENIHYNFGFNATQSWQTAMAEYLQSPSHRAAIMNPGFKRIGFGIATSGDRTYYSVVFSD